MCMREGQTVRGKGRFRERETVKGRGRDEYEKWGKKEGGSQIRKNCEIEIKKEEEIRRSVRTEIVKVMNEKKR